MHCRIATWVGGAPPRVARRTLIGSGIAAALFASLHCQMGSAAAGAASVDADAAAFEAGAVDAANAAGEAGPLEASHAPLEAGSADAGSVTLDVIASINHDRSSFGAFVELFEWRWTDIARECETVLGPKGFAAALVSPPSEHALIATLSEPAPQPTVHYPWWQRYQNVGYALDKSRSGTKAEFTEMVQRCAAVGVDIYVDAILNHMTAQVAGVGSNGTQFTKYQYPGLYSLANGDFHTPTCAIMPSDYTMSAYNVQHCELDHLADLNTGSTTVQRTLASYLIALVKMGVGGFRLDSAKHIAAGELQTIIGQVNAATAPIVPYYFLEVVDSPGEAIQPKDYFGIGGVTRAKVDVTEFQYSAVSDAFLGHAPIATLSGLAQTGAGLMPSSNAVAFTTNHDSERAAAIDYFDEPYYDLAMVFMLASPYGYPSVMSSYAFDRSTQAGLDMGPPSDAMGNTTPVYDPTTSADRCAWSLGAFAPMAGAATPGTWVCQHRARSVTGMLALRKAAAGEQVTNWWDDGSNRIAFGRGSKAFVVINREGTSFQSALQTGLPQGMYCDVVRGDWMSGACSGPATKVDASGTIQLSLPPYSASAFYVGANL